MLDQLMFSVDLILSVTFYHFTKSEDCHVFKHMAIVNSCMCTNLQMLNGTEYMLVSKFPPLLVTLNVHKS